MDAVVRDRTLIGDADVDLEAARPTREEAMAAVERIEGWRNLGDNVIETIINKSEKVKELKNKAKDNELSAKEKKELSDEDLAAMDDLLPREGN